MNATLPHSAQRHRARYYEPTTGRFVQPDPFEGFPTRPISLNAYPYAYDNPLMYTDASGRNPVLALAAGIVAGIVFGMAAGRVFGAATYEWALAGECGCDIQQAARSMFRWEWIELNTLSGGVLGGAAEALDAPVAVIGPGSLIAVSGVGLVVSVNAFVKTVETIMYETGLTTCTAIQLMMASAGIVGSSIGLVQAVRSWVGSGRLISWALQFPKSFRTERLLSRDVGYNVSPEYYWGPEGGATLGRRVTYITDKEAIADVIGEFEGGGLIQISRDQAMKLEMALGLEIGKLWEGFRISRIAGISLMKPRIPASGDPRFLLGPGVGLPGGGPELTIYLPVSEYGGPNIVQYIVEVLP